MRICAVIVLLVGWMASCRQDESMNTDWLYQRWRLIEVQSATNNQVVDMPSGDWTIAEFRPNGTILYGANGRYTACCSPNRFKREGNRLDLKNVSSIPIPETDGNCATVKCGWSGDAWQILSLLPETLILQTNSGLYVYRSYS